MQYQDENNTVIDHFPISESIMIALRLLKNCHIKKLRISILEKNKLCSVLTVPNESFSVSTPKENINLKNINIKSDLKKLLTGPAPALALGLSGLIPFVSAPVYMYNAGYFLSSIATAQLTYGATILSFLGGVRWGMLVAGNGDDMPANWAQYSWSVTPSLIAWAALLVPSTPGGYILCVSGLLAAAVVDLQQSSFPPWFRALRFLLSFFAVISLLTSLIFNYTLGAKKQPSDYLT